ncbi:MAG: isochorismatase family protein [Acidimicrobiales bacterium]
MSKCRPSALIVVDLQRDFCEGGSLPVPGGASCASRVSEYLAQFGGSYAAVTATQDWHVDPKGHFGDPPDWVDSWPVHCIANTDGAEFHPNLGSMVDVSKVFDSVFRKGAYAAAYSGFEGEDIDGVPLAEWLKNQEVESVDVVGIATSVCVKATALAALENGLHTRVLLDLCADLAEPEGITDATVGELTRRGAEVVDDSTR